MNTHDIKSIFLFLAFTIFLFYAAHSFARESSTTFSLDESRSSTFLEITTILRNITLDIDFARSLSSPDVARPKLEENIPQSIVGRSNPFTSRTTPSVSPSPPLPSTPPPSQTLVLP